MCIIRHINSLENISNYLPFNLYLSNRSFIFQLRPVYTCNFCCDFQCYFRLFIDVKEWINNGCSEYMFLHPNIRV